MTSNTAPVVPFGCTQTPTLVLCESALLSGHVSVRDVDNLRAGFLLAASCMLAALERFLSR